MLIYISSSPERHIFQFISYIRQNFWRTDLTVQKIANDLNLNISKAVGYENPLSFSKAYKRVFGHSPRNSKT